MDDKKPNHFQRASIEELESRILYSADSAAFAAYSPMGSAAAAEIRVIDTQVPDARQDTDTRLLANSESARHELVLVETDVPDYRQLLDDLVSRRSDNALIDIVLLDAQQDGIGQISDTLSQYKDLDAVHLISHGSPGEIRLGSTTLNLENLDIRSSEILHWGAALDSTGDFLIYGCDLAAADAGRTLVDSLATLTGADIAASDDLTGQADRGGDWVLEYSRGRIDATLPFTADLVANWTGLLVNNPPVPGDNTVTTNEDSALTFTASDFTISDADGDTLSKIQITGLPANGVLALSGTAVSANDEILQANLGNLSFTPDSNWNGTTGFTWLAYDGTEYSTGAATMSITVTAVNDPPVLSGIEAAALTYTENDPATPVTATLTISDIDDSQIDSATVKITGNYQSGEDRLSFTDANGITGLWDAATGTLSLTGPAPISDFETALRSVSYLNSSDDPSALLRQVSFSISDGNSSSNLHTRDINITAVNDAPGMTAAASNPAFSEGGAAVTLFSGTGVDTVESGDTIEAIILTVDNLSDGADEVLGIDGNSVALTDGQSGTTGNGYSYTVGLSGATATVTITTTGATAAAVQTLVDGLSYRNSADLPTEAARTVTLTSLQDSGGTDTTALSIASTVTVAATNNDPVNVGTLPTDITVTEDITGNVDLSAINLSDADANGGDLTLTLATAGGGRLTASSGGGVTVSGSDTTTLILTGSQSSLNAFLDTVGNIRYRHPVANTNGNNADRITVTINDNGYTGAGGGLDIDLGSVNVDITPVNDAPYIASLDTDTFNYSIGSGPQIIDQATVASVSDVDSADFDGGTLTVAIVSGNVTTEDVLAIRNQGTAAGQIGVSGSNVSYEGTVIGTFAGGSSGNSLVITLNSQADAAATSALIQNISYENTNTGSLVEDTRHINFTLTDGDGGTGTTRRTTVDVGAVNTAPVISLPGSTLNYTENDAATPIDTTATVTDADSTDLYLGSMLLSFSSGGTTNDQLAIRNQGTGAGQIGVSGSTISFEGVAIATFSGGGGGSDLRISFNSSATPASAQALLRNITYANGSDNPATATRTVTVITKDGDGGTSATTSIDIAMEAVNDAPVLTSPATLTADEETATPVSGISVSDVDANAGLFRARLQVNNGSLDITLSGTTIVAGSNGSADITIEGDLSTLNAALATVSYKGNTNVTGTAADTLTITIDDRGNTGTGGALLDTGTVQIDITNIDDAPVLAAIEGTALPYTENDAATAITASLTLSDVDTSDIASATVTISGNYRSGEDTLTFTDANGISGTWDAASGTLTLSGVASLANYQTALRSITYQNSSDAPSTLTRTIGFTVNDGSANSNTTSRDIDITAVNDAPVLDNTATPSLTAEDEDSGAPSGAVGSLVTEIADLSGGSLDNISDADTPAATGIAVTATDSSNGSWWYSIDNGSNWNALGAVSDASARLLAADASTRLYFQPDADYNGTLTSAITFRAWDMSSGSNGALADASVQDGATAFSTASDTAELTINAINDAPTASITPASYNATEQTALTLHGTGLSVGDIDAEGSDIKVTVSVSGGKIDVVAGSTGVSISRSGQKSVTLTGTVAEINDLLAGNLGATIHYTNPYDAPSSSVTLSLTANDQGNTGSGGSLSSTDTATINIAAVDDDPIAVNDRFGLVFDGTDDYVDAGSDVSLEMSATMTIEAWVRPEGRGGLIINRENEYEVAINPNGMLKWAFRNSDPGWVWHHTGYKLPDNQWAHIAVSYDNGIIATYVNGSLVDLYQGSGNIGDYGSRMDNLYIGARAIITSSRFDGQIDEVRIWSTARSAAEIQATLDAELVGNETGLAGYWKFDESSGGTAADSSSNSNTGTLVDGGLGSDGPQHSGYLTDEDSQLTIAAASGVLANDIDPDGTALTVTAIDGNAAAVGSTITLASGALLTVNADGSFSYDPNGVFDTLAAGDSTTDSFDYTMQDASGVTDSATTTITIDGRNDAPTAANHTTTINEGTAYTFQSSDFGYSDIDGDTFAGIETTTLETAGALQLSGVDVTLNQVISAADIAAGNLVYTPAQDGNGIGYDSFAFTVNDGTTDSITSYTQTFDVTPVNDAPVNGIPADKSVDEDSVLAINDLAIADVDGDLSSIELSVFNGSLNVTLSGAATISNGANDSTSLTLSGTQTDLNATLATLQYQGNLNYNGFEVLVVVSTDAAGLSDSDTLPISVNAVNDEQSLDTNAALTLDEGATATITSAVLATSDIEQTATQLIYTINTAPAHGSLVLSGTTLASGNSFTQDDIDNNRLVYTHDGGETSSDSFTFTVDDGAGAGTDGTFNLTITPVNDAPVLANIPLFGTEDTPITFYQSSFDAAFSDAEGDSLTAIKITSLPANGTLTLSGADVSSNDVITTGQIGNLQFTPDSNWSGTTSFGWQGSDGTTYAAAGATVTITISAINDAPVFSGLDGNPWFTEDGAAVVLDSNVTVTDVELTTADNFSGASLFLLRDGGAAAEDQFGFIDSNGLSLSGGHLIKNGQAIASFDTTTPGTLVIDFTDTNGEIPGHTDVNAVLQQLSYSNSSDTPPASVSLQWLFFDGNSGVQGTGNNLSASGTSTVTITASNDAPTALSSASYSIAEGDALSLDGSGSSDPEGDALTYRWDLNNDGSYDELVTGNATPGIDWATLQAAGIIDDGGYTLGLQVDDGNGGIATTTAGLTVSNTAPSLSVTGAASVDEDAVYTLNLAATDFGNDSISGWQINWGDGNIDSITGNPGSVTHVYTQPDLTYNIIATATDEDGSYLQNGPAVTVNPVNDEQILSLNAGLTVAEGATATIGNTLLLTSDIDNTAAELVYTVTAAPANGRLESGSNPGVALTGFTQQDIDNGLLRYVHDGGETSSDSFSFSVDDGAGTASNGVFSITVTPVNDAPTDIAPNGFSINENSDTTGGVSLGSLTATDSDPGDTVSYSVVAGLDSAVFTIGGANNDELILDDGIIDFEAKASYSVTVRATDSAGATYDETLTVTVNDLNEAPSVSLANQTTTLPEDSDTSSSIKLADIVISDDALGTNTLTLSGADAASFEIIGTELHLKAGVALDYESKTSYSVTIELDDSSVGASPDDSIGFSLTISDVNEFDPVINDQTFSIAENSANGSSVGTVAASDADTSQTLSWAITAGNTSNAFQINSSTGEITVNDVTQLDHEATPNYSLTIEVTDSLAPNRSNSATITINIDDVNEADPDISDQIFSIAENSANGAVIGTVVATDDDTSQTLTYSIVSGNTNNAFSINASSGKITVNDGTQLNHEATPVYSLTVEVTDSLAPARSSSATITININDINEADPDISDQVFTIAENSANGAVIGTVVATDDDTSQTLTYSIISGNTSNAFSINASTGTITVNDGTQLDHEATASYALMIEVTDSLAPTRSSQATITINIDDVNEADPDISDQVFTIAENSANGAVIGTVVATDDDTSQTLTYSIISGNTSNAFSINASTGTITVNDGTQLDHEATASYALMIEVTDSLAPTRSSQATITINIDDVNEADPDISDQVFSIVENSANGAVIGAVLATDDDTSQTLNFSIVSGNTNNAFGINNSTGEITVNDGTQLDHETTPEYELVIEVMDSLAPTRNSQATVTINIDDVNEFDPVINNQDFSINENSINGTVIGSVVATDADTSQTLSYRIVSGNSNNAFSIDAASGQLSVNDGAQLNHEAMPGYALLIEVTDSLTPTRSSQATATITINDVNEFTPVISDQSFTIAENSTNNSSVGTVIATDADSSQTLTWSITGGNTNNAFNINSATGEITVNQSSELDHETTPVYSLTIKVTDSLAPTRSSSAVVTIQVSDVNEFDPTIVDQEFSVAENSSNGSSVGTVIASDADTSQTLSYSIVSGNSNNAFSIDASTGTITVNDGTQLDHEATLDYALVIEVTDSLAPTRSSQAIATITIDDVNEFDPVISDQIFNIDENSANGAVIASVVATDDDTSQTLSYSIVSGNANNTFSIDTSSGEITVNDTTQLNHEATPVYSLTVEVTDSLAPTRSSLATITINIDDVNEADPDISDQIFSIAENSANGAVIGTVVATDDDTSQTLTYSIVSGNTNNAFSINASSGKITVNDRTQLNHEATPVYSLTVEVTDSLAPARSSSATITINIDDVNEADPDISDQIFSIAENSANGAVIGTVVATDDDTSQTLTYSIISGNTSNAFSINASTGTITVNDGSQLDHEATASYALMIEVTDSLAPTRSSRATVTINIDDVNEADPDISDQVFSIDENSADGTAIGTVLATDADSSQTLTYTITAGNTGDAFAINSNTGKLTVANSAVLDRETTTGFNLVITVTDSLAPARSSNATVTILLNDQNEFHADALHDTDNTTNAITENAATGTAVGITANAVDLDATNNFIHYALSDDDGGRFKIDPDTGVITLASAIDRESDGASRSITVRATSADGSLIEQEFSISILDIDEFDLTTVDDVDTSANTLSENASTGSYAGITVSSHDNDATLNSILYSLDNDAGGLFTIDNLSGVVSLNAALDYERSTQHDIIVRATSADGSTISRSFTITVTDSNESPVGDISDADNAANLIAENAPAGSTVGILATASDSDGTDSITYSLDNDAGGLFRIDNQGLVTLSGVLDREAAATHSITVRATSSDGSFSLKDFDIAIGDINEHSTGAIVDTNPLPNHVEEGAAAGTLAGIIAFASDADATTSSITYSLDNNAGGRFAIDPSSGIVHVADAAALDRETSASHEISVRATSADGSFSTQSYIIAIDDRNEFDVALILDSDSTSDSVSENSAIGTTVGISAVATDADASNNHISYDLLNDDGGRFTVNPLTGVVTVAGALDRETDGDSRTITLRASSSDGSFTTRDFRIGLTDENEFGVGAISDIDNNANTIAENYAIGTTIPIQAAANDSDASDTVSYSLSNDAGGRFSINPQSGIVRIAGALDAEQATQHIITVTATSTDGSQRSQDFIITISDSNEFTAGDITDTDSRSNSVIENSSAGTFTGIIAHAEDPDLTDSVRYILSNDANGRFNIDSVSGAITTNTPLDRESGERHVVTVTAVSTDGSQSQRDFIIDVIDRNDNLPIITPGQILSINETATAGTSIGKIEATDADASTTFQQWTIISGNHSGTFELDIQTGELRLAADALPDYESQPEYTLYVSVSDGVHDSVTTAVTVKITNDDEKPLANNDSLTTDEEQQVTTGNVFANDRPGDNPIALFSFTGTSLQGGQVSYLGQGAFSYTPKPDFNGMDSFGYTIRDASGDLSTARVWIMVNPVNDPVAGEPDHYTLEEDQALSVDATNGVLANDHDIDQDKLTVTLLEGSAHGIITLNQDGSFHYTPEQDFNGSDGFVYQVSDPAGTTSKVHVALEINPGNDAPQAFNSHISLDEDTQYVFSLNDFGFSDIDGDSIKAIEIPRLPEMGQILLGNKAITAGEQISVEDITAGRLVFIPDQDTFGEIYASTGFRVFDGTILSKETATLAISVAGVDDPPVIVTPQTLATLMNNTIHFDSGLANQFSLSDRDEAFQIQNITLTVSSGTLTFSSIPEVDSITGMDSTEIRLTGTAKAIDAALSQLIFVPEKGFSGEVRLVMIAGDHGDVDAQITLLIGSPNGITVDTIEAPAKTPTPPLQSSQINPVVRKLHGFMAQLSPFLPTRTAAMTLDELEYPDFTPRDIKQGMALSPAGITHQTGIAILDMASLSIDNIKLNPGSQQQAISDALKNAAAAHVPEENDTAAWGKIPVAAGASLLLALLGWASYQQKSRASETRS